MPFVSLDHSGVTPLVRRCINHRSASHELGTGQLTTMRVCDQWNALTIAYPPGLPWAGSDEPSAPPRFSGLGGLPVRCYVCRVCGYVEL